MADQNDPVYATERSPSSKERREREALREAIAEQVARNVGVQPQLDAIAAILKAYAPEIEKMRILRGHFPMKVDGNIISIDESVLSLISGSFMPENTCVNGEPGVQYVMKKGAAFAI